LRRFAFDVRGGVLFLAWEFNEGSGSWESEVRVAPRGMQRVAHFWTSWVQFWLGAKRSDVVQDPTSNSRQYSPSFLILDAEQQRIRDARYILASIVQPDRPIENPRLVRNSMTSDGLSPSSQFSSEKRQKWLMTSSILILPAAAGSSVPIAKRPSPIRRIVLGTSEPSIGVYRVLSARTAIVTLRRSRILNAMCPGYISEFEIGPASFAQ